MCYNSFITYKDAFCDCTSLQTLFNSYLFCLFILIVTSRVFFTYVSKEFLSFCFFILLIRTIHICCLHSLWPLIHISSFVLLLAEPIFLLLNPSFSFSFSIYLSLSLFLSFSFPFSLTRFLFLFLSFYLCPVFFLTFFSYY